MAASSSVMAIEILEKDQPYKAVLINGSRMSASNEVQELYKQEGYLILGDGSTKLSSLDLSILENRIDKNTRIDINAHGVIIKGVHYMDGCDPGNATIVFLEKIGKVSNNKPLKIYIHSCFCVIAVSAIDALPENSVLITDGADKITSEAVFHASFLESCQDLSITDPIEEFCKRFLLNVRQTATIVIKNGKNNFKYTVRPPARMLSNPEEIIRYFKAQRLEFVEKYNESFPVSKIDIRTLPELSHDEALQWKKNYFEYVLTTPITWNELSGVRALLKEYFQLELSEKELNGARCFRNDGILALDYLQKAYDKDSEPRKRKANVQQAFHQIKNLNGFSIEAVYSYSLPLSEVNKAKCGIEALEYIKQGYYQAADPEIQKTNAQKIFNSIKDLYSPWQFSAVCDYDLSPEEVLGAECFDMNSGVYKHALDYLKQAYNKSPDPRRKKENAQEAFNQIKDFCYTAQFTAFVDYEIAPKEVKSAQCFNFYGPNPALIHMKKAYDKASDPESKRASVHEIFNQIKQLSSPGQIVAVLEYGLPLEAVKSAACLSADIYIAALDYIKKACDKESEPDKKKIAIQNVFNQIKELSAPEQFAAVIDYGLKPEEVKGAKCFFYAPDTAQHYVKQSYGTDSNPEKRTINTQEMFQLIKDLDRQWKIKAVADYKIPPDEVNRALCFNSSEELATKTLGYIEQACAQASLDERPIIAKNAFTYMELSQHAEKIVTALDKVNAFDWNRMSWKTAIPLVQSIYNELQKENAASSKKKSGYLPSFFTPATISPNAIKERLKHHLMMVFNNNPDLKDSLLKQKTPSTEDLVAALRCWPGTGQSSRKPLQVSIHTIADIAHKAATLSPQAFSILKKKYHYQTPAEILQEKEKKGPRL